MYKNGITNNINNSGNKYYYEKQNGGNMNKPHYYQ